MVIAEIHHSAIAASVEIQNRQARQSIALSIGVKNRLPFHDICIGYFPKEPLVRIAIQVPTHRQPVAAHFALDVIAIDGGRLQIQIRDFK